MIQEVVNKIIEAEQSAKQITATAQDEANSIILAAYSVAEERKLTAREENKQYVKQCAASASEKAEKAKQAYITSQASKDQQTIIAARNNTAAALKYVLEKL